MSRDFERADLRDWSEQLAGLMDEMLQRTFVPFRVDRAWRPSMNIYEGPRAYFICVDLAGCDGEELSAEVRHERHVILRGRRRQPRPASIPQLSMHLLEIDEGPFCREFELPEAVDGRAMATTYEQGYLWLTLPKKAR
jgi:HSP20 family protein